MLFHWLKLIWARKTANLLIMAEIIVTFMVIFALFAAGRHYYQIYKQPLGFNIQNNWSMTIGLDQNADKHHNLATLKQLVTALEAQSKISSVGLTRFPMLTKSYWSSHAYFNQQHITFNLFEVSTHSLQDWGVKLIAGQWFYPQTKALDYRPIMINQAMVKQLAATQDQAFDPIGTLIYHADPKAKPPRKVIGVIEDLRQHGDFTQSTPLIIYPYSLKTNDDILSHIHISFALPPSVEQQATIEQIVQDIAPNWSFQLRSWQALRQTLLNETLVPLLLTAAVVGFLLLMVTIGLMGVLWQSITARTFEIGLRRALGANQGAIQRQLIGELILMGLIATTIASILLLPLPALKLIAPLNWSLFWFSLLSTTATIIISITLCAYYPCRAATTTPAAIALRHD